MAEVTRPQDAFGDLSALWNLQVVTISALGYVLYRFSSREMHR